MVKITVIQHDFDGQGNDRSADFWRKPTQVQLKIRDIERSHNMDHTTIMVDGRTI